MIANQRATVDRVGDELARVEALGYDSAWMPGIPNGPDVLTLFAATAHRTRRIEVGPAIVSAHGRHPVALASQALTSNDALGGRLTLGIGVSHQRIVEDFFGLDYSASRSLHDRVPAGAPPPAPRREGRLRRPARAHELPTRRRGAASRRRRCSSRRSDRRCSTSRAPTQPVRRRGWSVSAPSAEQTVPLVRAAAQRAGRPEPRILASLPIALTNDNETAAAWAADEFGMYGRLPAYKAVLEREGLDSAAGIAIYGDESTLTQGGRPGCATAGVTDLQITPFGDDESPPSHGRVPDQPPLAPPSRGRGARASGSCPAPTWAAGRPGSRSPSAP